MSKESLLFNKDLRDDAENKNNVNPTFLLALILLLGMALRFYNLGTESYWIDEMSTVVEGQQDILQLITSGRFDQPPAFYLPFHLWVQAFGTSEISTRSFSTLVGMGSIVLIYLIGRELFGKSVGLLSAFLMATSQFQVYYSQQARYYSFFEFSTLLSFLFFILALRSKRKIYFMLYGMASVIMVYSHAFGLFILAAQAIFFILYWKKYRSMIALWFTCQVLILLAIIPYFYPLIFGGGVGGAVDTNIGGLAPPLLLDPLRSVYRFIMPPRGERGWGIMLVNYAVAAALFVVGISIYAARQGMETFLDAARGWFATPRQVPDLKSKLLFLICWLLCPIVLPFVLSMVFRPIYLDRYTISAAPALYLLLALGIFSIRKVAPIIISLGALVIMIAPSLGYYYVTDVHEQWKEAAIYVDENSEPGDVIVFAPNQGIGIEQRTFNRYYQGTLQGYGLGSELVDSVAISDALKPIISGHDRLWVVIRNNPNESSDRYESFFVNSDQPGMHLIKEHHFVDVSAYLFELSK